MLSPKPGHHDADQTDPKGPRTQRIGSPFKGVYRGIYRDIWVYGTPNNQIIAF